MMCMVHNPVGVSGNTGRVDFDESCEVVDYQLKSGLEVRGQQNQNARMGVSINGFKIVNSKRTHWNMIYLCFTLAAHSYYLHGNIFVKIRGTGAGREGSKYS